ncbi:MAG: hypothetical protein H6R00_4055 [Proteobacteria bacterium]|nr:hypothetical protein [Pseudomonadota bacterium]
MTVPALISTTAQSLEADQIVHLFELDLALIGGPVYRFTSSTLETKPVSFGGEIYSPSPVEASGFEMTSQGTLPRPTVKVANVAGIFSAAINEFGDLVGCVIRRIRTFRRFLDGEADADPDAHFPIDVFRIEQKSNQNRVYVEWTLAAAFDQEGRMLPGRQVLQSACPLIYRRWNGTAFDYSAATCPYNGDACFDATGAVTTPAKDRCSKRLKSGCIKRFGSNPLPFGGFPGVGRGSAG